MNIGAMDSEGPGPSIRLARQRSKIELLKSLGGMLVSIEQ